MRLFKQHIILYLALTLVCVFAGCSHIVEYPVAAPITVDPDNAHVERIPKESDPNYLMDKIYYMIFFPTLEGIDNLFGLLGPGEAKNVNSFGFPMDAERFKCHTEGRSQRRLF